MQGNCPSTNGTPQDNNLESLDLKTPNVFDNSFFKLLLEKKGLLQSDQVLYSGGVTDSLVEAYSGNDPVPLDKDFSAAMIKMGSISPLTGSNGEIRRNCRKRNWSTCFMGYYFELVLMG